MTDNCIVCDASIDDGRVCSEHAEDDLFVPLEEDEKKPSEAFDGWPVDPDHPGVYTEPEVETSEWRHWGLIANAERDLLVIDIDLYKMENWRAVVDALSRYLDITRVVVTPSGGLHIYLRITDPSITRDNLRDTIEAIDHVELKGPMARGIAVHTTVPGYDVWTDEEPVEIEDVEMFAEDFPVLEYDPEPESETPGHPRDRSEYEPTRSREEVLDIGMTDDIEVVFDAIAHTDFEDFRLKSPQTEGGNGVGSRKSFDPVFGDTSDSGTRLGHEDGFIYRKGNIPLDTLQVVALEERIIHDVNDYPAGGDFWRAVDELRERGADIPEYEAADGVDWSAIERTERIGHETDDPPAIDLLHGSPRYDHKTTQLFEDHAGYDGRTYSVVSNHELGEEQCRNHLGPGTYGIDAQRVVHLKGQNRACPTDCTHHRDGGLNHGKHRYEATKALEQHRVVSPKVFAGVPDVCPHFATILAADMANWVVLVPEMLRSVDPSEEYSVIVDEESTLKRLRPKAPGLLTFRACHHPGFDANITPDARSIDREDAVALRETIDERIDDLERVPARYRNARRAADALVTLIERINDCGLGVATDIEDATRRIEGIEVPQVDLVGTVSERDAALTFIREEFQFDRVTEYLEPLIAGASIQVIQSGPKFTVKLIPDLSADVVFHREFFAGADRIGAVGNEEAAWFAWQLGVDDPEVTVMDGLSEIQKHNLDIVLVPGDESDRRRAMDEVATELTNHDVENLLIPGSKSRARDAVERLPAESHLADSTATVDGIEDIFSLDGWNVTSYMNSRITRGVDLPMQVSICRSTQFDASVWDAQEDLTPIGEYVRATETINAMLRGAGQGEHHVAIVPDDIADYLDWGLEECVTTIDETEAIVELVLDVLTDVERDPDLDAYRCEGCDRIFVQRDPLLSHVCAAAD